MSMDDKKPYLTLLSRSHPSQGREMSRGVSKRGGYFMTMTALTRIVIVHHCMNIFLCDLFWQLKWNHSQLLTTKKYYFDKFYGVYVVLYVVFNPKKCDSQRKIICN